MHAFQRSIGQPGSGGILGEKTQAAPRIAVPEPISVRADPPAWLQRSAASA